MKIEPLEKRPLQNDEKDYKRAYLSGSRTLWERPMTYAEYDNYDREGLIVHTESAHYYKDKTKGLQGITNIPVDSVTNALVTVHRRYSYPVLHNHDYVEIIYVASGKCMHFVDGASFSMQAGDVCILAPNAFHAISCTGDESCILNIMVNRQFFDRSFLSLLRGGKLLIEFLEGILYARTTSPYILFPTGEDEWLHILAQRLLIETKSELHAYEHSISLLTGEFLLQLVREYEMLAIVPNQLSSTQNGLIVAILGYLSVNYNRATLAETARFFGYSPAYLSRTIKENTGKTFRSIINELQMEHAAEMLKSGQKSVTEISQEIGCFDSSHFNKKFKSYFGMLPKQYIKMNGQDERKEL